MNDRFWDIFFYVFVTCCAVIMVLITVVFAVMCYREIF